MRNIEISENEYWVIPDLHTVAPAYDLFLDHYDSTKADGIVDSITISGVEYKSVFYSGVARFYIGDDLRFNARATQTFLATLDAEGTPQEIQFTAWCGISKDSGKLPAVLFFEDNDFAIIPKPTPESFCIKIGSSVVEIEDTTGISIESIPAEFVTVWLGAPETIPATAKTIRVLPVCEGSKKVSFILQNGELRTWHLSEKRTSADFKELIRYSKTVTDLSTGNESTYEISDGENSSTTTLFIAGLTRSELDEISQLAVSRYVTVDGLRAEIVRRSAVISGNSQGGNFSIDVKNI